MIEKFSVRKRDGQYSVVLILEIQPLTPRLTISTTAHHHSTTTAIETLPENSPSAISFSLSFVHSLHSFFSSVFPEERLPRLLIFACTPSLLIPVDPKFAFGFHYIFRNLTCVRVTLPLPYLALYSTCFQLLFYIFYFSLFRVEIFLCFFKVFYVVAD